jgi:hypothetical protein
MTRRASDRHFSPLFAADMLFMRRRHFRYYFLR